jgi:hypothetical protein
VRASDGSGSAELLLDHDRDLEEVVWSADGAWLLAVLGGGTSMDIVSRRADSDEPPEPLLATEADEWGPVVSPDNRWLAYVSGQTGRPEVFVVPFPAVADGKWQISTDGGREPRWSADGRELYIRHDDGFGIDVVDMSGGPAAAGRTTLFDFPDDQYWELNPFNHLYEVADDGRLIMLRAGQGDITGDLVIVQNFFGVIEERVGGS